MHCAVSLVVDMVGDNKAAAAIAEVALVVDTGVEVARIVATAEVTPRRYFAEMRMSEVLCNRVAIAAVVIAGTVDTVDLVVVASYVPLSTLHNTLLIQCVYLVQRTSIM